MSKFKSLLKIFSLLLLVLFLNCPPIAADSLPLKYAVDLSQCEQVIEVVPGVYVAVGYGASNSILIEGDDGVIIVDTTISTENAEGALAKFRQITKKPVKAIIYTHGDYDQTGGTKVFARESEPEIYARGNFTEEFHKTKAIEKILKARAYKQQGLFLSPQEAIYAGRLVPCHLPVIRDEIGDGFVPPNHTFTKKRLPLEIAGVQLELVAAPGQSEDNLYVWLPEKKVLICGDNYFQTFPNLYAISGIYRDPSQWADSLDKMLSEGAEYLIPGHTLPVSGAENVKQVLTDYRDAIRYVFTSSLEGINGGLTPDELVETIKLPADLSGQPYLEETYGTIPWTVRGIYAAYLGWFDGNPTNLFPLSPVEESQRIAQLAGGEESLLKSANNALVQGDYQWASQLADYAIALKFKTEEAKTIKAEALSSLAEENINFNARHYYMSVAKELREQIER